MTALSTLATKLVINLSVVDDTILYLWFSDIFEVGAV